MTISIDRCTSSASLPCATASLAFACVLAIPGAAHGQDARAAEFKARADAAMDAGAFADAIPSYRASYQLQPSAVVLYDIGSAYERLGDYALALAYLGQFARVAPRDQLARVPMLDRVLASVRSRFARSRMPFSRDVVLAGEGAKPAPEAAAAHADAMTSRWWFWAGVIVAGGVVAASVTRW